VECEETPPSGESIDNSGLVEADVAEVAWDTAEDEGMELDEDCDPISTIEGSAEATEDVARMPGGAEVCHEVD
jgi:hypothetical protein